MKKSHLLLGLGISISWLTACQKQETTTSSTTEVTTTTVEETTVAPKPVADYTLYNAVLQGYKEALKKEGGSFNKENINQFILIAKNNPYLQGASYILYDFDKNGVDELLIATTSNDNKHAILDIRTIVDGKVVQVTNAENQLGFIGENEYFPTRRWKLHLYWSCFCKRSCICTLQMERNRKCIRACQRRNNSRCS